MELAQTCVGTPYYLSPEICQNKPYNNKSWVANYRFKSLSKSDGFSLSYDTFVISFSSCVKWGSQWLSVAISVFPEVFELI